MDSYISQYEIEQDEFEQEDFGQETDEQETDVQMQHLVNIFFGKEDKRTAFVVQQGEYNSRNIVASLWENNHDGVAPMDLTGRIVKVAYKYGAITTPLYSTKVEGDNKISFTLPRRVLAALGMVDMQLKVYRGKGLLNSAVMPFKVLASIKPSIYPEEGEDVQSDLLYILGNITPEKIEAWDKAEENAKKYTDEKFEELSNAQPDDQFVEQLIEQINQSTDDKLTEFGRQVDEAIKEVEENFGDEALRDFVSYSQQEVSAEQQSQARMNLGIEYATDEEVLEAVIEEGIVFPIVTEEGAFLACADDTILIM